MIQQGNWIQPMIDQQSPNMNIGFLPIPINEEPADAIVVNVSNYWVVNKQSSAERKKQPKFSKLDGIFRARKVLYD